jgi:diguanylate cyclase (GGDEF)-like protein
LPRQPTRWQRNFGGNEESSELIEQLGAPFALASGTEVSVGISIGISLCPSDSGDAESLVRLADAALYRAKQAGRGTWRFYSLQDVAEVSRDVG